MPSSDPMEGLKNAGRDVMSAFGERAMSTVSERLTGLTDKLQDVADGGPIGKAVAEGGKQAAGGGSAVGGALKGAVSGVKDKITGGGGGSGNSGGKATKSTNIVETIDVGVPVKVAYNQWTEFGAFPSFMKKVESVQAEDETKINWKAQIFWSHRTWESTILEQVPDERIVWRSKGQKGHVDGAVTFHEIGPNLTRILVVLEYYPQGFFEKTGNIWEAQGRRARAELRHFRRHVMTRTILEPEEVEGWRGVIEDGEVVKSHEEVVEEEEAQADEEQADEEQADEEQADDEQPEDETDEEAGDEADDEVADEEDSEEGEAPEDEYDESEEEPEAEDEESEEEPEGEYEEDPEAEEEYEEPEAEDEYEEEPEAEEEYEEPEAEEEAEDEYEEDPEAEEEYEEPEAEEEYEESEDELEDEEPEDEDETEKRPRRRRKAS